MSSCYINQLYSSLMQIHVEGCGTIMVFSAINSCPILRYAVVRSMLPHVVVGSLVVTRYVSKILSPFDFCRNIKNLSV